MKWVKFIISASITLALFYLLNFPVIEKTPFAIGDFANPYSGFWQNGEMIEERLDDREIPGLQESVIVQWDNRGVPHVFARNAHDLYFVQGYLTARDRLWQMDIITRASAGRVAEVIPERVEFDRYRRRTGMLYAAEVAVKAAMADETSRLAMEALSDGVNAWIDQLTPASYPLEFKILNYAPEAWSPLKSALLLKYMSWNLSARNNEVLWSRTRTALGDSVMSELFFHEPLNMKTIIPDDTPWEFKPLEAPSAPDSLFSATMLAFENMLQPAADLGSNNWVVDGSKTLSGYPILSNDPHLGLNLPSIWYEMQLVAPEINVYGVTLPGAPGVVIGFNENIAWGVTNAGVDVMDWYQMHFHPEDPWKYRFGDEWREATPRIEEIHVRNSETVIDTIAMTHLGPVSYREGEESLLDAIPSGMALRWVAHDPSLEVKAFWLLNRAVGYNDFVEALSFYDCPAQNFVFASRHGDIAMHHHGKIPLRWKHQGRFISDGSNPAYEWQGYIPREHIPHAKNPARGFLGSANQNPVTDRYPYQMYGFYATFERGARIHERLLEMNNITPEDMMALQNDNLNLHARAALPAMLSSLQDEELSLFEYRNLELLQQWNYESHRDSIAPIIFQYWWNNFQKLVWEDEFSHPEFGQLKFPRKDVTIDLLLNEPDSRYFDNILTEDYPETLADILLLSFQRADLELSEELGQFSEDWRWGKSRGTDITHLARIPGMSRLALNTNGNRGIVNATGKTHGPSWRMVVALGPEVKAWGIYPGGQSGNPGSANYDAFIDDWVEGQYYELIYLKSPTETHPDVVAKTILKGGGQ